MREIFNKLLTTVHLGLLASTLCVVGVNSATAAEGDQAQSTTQRIAASVLDNIGRASWISEGKGPHTAYVFFDPNCPFCHKLFEETRGLVNGGKLRLRWIPVGILTTTSHGKAVAMLGAKNRLKAFYQNEDHYSMGNGGIDEDFASPAVEKRLKANEALLGMTHMGVVPLMLFYSKDGTPVLIQGAPPKDKLLPILAQVK